METAKPYAKKILPIVRRVREMLLPRYGNVAFTEKEPGGKENPLTKLDVEVEHFLKQEFAKAYADIPFVGEETSGNRKAEKFWLVDPIDGTTYFVRGMPFCTTMAALVQNGEVIFSAVYDFVNDIMYHAEKGAGAFKNGEPMRVSSRPLRLSRMELSIELGDRARVEKLVALTKRCHIFHAGASGHELSLVACGKIDGSIQLGPGSKDYDLAAGTFLVKEAGGIVANIGFKTYDYRNNEFIAANPVIFSELTEGPDAIFPVK